MNKILLIYLIMKKIILLLLFILSLCHWFIEVKALDLFTNSNEIIYCKNDDCSLEKWTEIVKWGIHDIEKNKKASVFVQDIVKYLLTFITIVAVVYIIYAWFKVLTAWWNDEEVKKSKATLINIFLWILLMWLAYSIVQWMIKVLWAN